MSAAEAAGAGAGVPAGSVGNGGDRWGRVADAVRRAVDDAPPLPAAAVALLRATGLREVAR